MAKARKLTQQEKEEIRNKIDWEGFDYYFLEYESLSKFEGTELEDSVERFYQAAKEIKDILGLEEE